MPKVAIVMPARVKRLATGTEDVISRTKMKGVSAKVSMRGERKKIVSWQKVLESDGVAGMLVLLHPTTPPSSIDTTQHHAIKTYRSNGASSSNAPSLSLRLLSAAAAACSRVTCLTTAHNCLGRFEYIASALAAVFIYATTTVEDFGGETDSDTAQPAAHGIGVVRARQRLCGQRSVQTVHVPSRRHFEDLARVAQHLRQLSQGLSSPARLSPPTIIELAEEVWER
ncbi:hypothetical protein BD310DRAFT_981341 [Dichomitus squalens]|uniref:Uncharacterized protein n=1 Tax=Dichomitus squalens TaxID=114155 RepID=A0A4Q9PHE5_9APHY|nr:hypothetical protein BD310DRAFT_981341 [Dichomitus squalens]